MKLLKKTRTRAFDGWLTNYRVNRPLDEYEVSAKLDVKKNLGLMVRDRGMLKFNSMFMEWVDQHFMVRGWAAMGGVPVGVMLLYFSLTFTITANRPLASGEMPTQGMLVAMFVAVAGLMTLFVGVVFFLIKKDFFCYTHYPIRFNRQNRKVYVFRSGGMGGALELDWSDGHWFVGYNDANNGYDVRCHILNADGIIQHTFAVAQGCDTKVAALQHWELIRRYMEEPLSALPFPPLRLYLTTKPTLRNCFIIQVGSMGGISKYMLLSLPWTFFRWISQKTCRHPIWPESVEAACQIPIDDPYRLPEPAVAGESVPDDEASLLKEREYQYKAIAEADALDEREGRLRP